MNNQKEEGPIGLKNVSDILRLFPPECIVMFPTEEAECGIQAFRDEMHLYFQGKKQASPREQIEYGPFRITFEEKRRDEPVRYPEIMERTLSSGEVLRFSVYPMWWAPRDLAVMGFVPDEEILHAHTNGQNILVIATDNMLDDPQRCLYVYGRHQMTDDGSIHYELDGMIYGYKETQDALYDPTAKKFLVINCEKSGDA
jgi:hypothetical protein